MRDALLTNRTRRAQIVSILTGTGAIERTAPVVASVAALVAAGGLAACDGATFGLYNNPAGSSDCSIASGSKNLASVNDAPWTADDVGKLITVQGAGAAGAPLETVIESYSSASAITLRHAALSTVSSTSSSAAGIAIWGRGFNSAFETNATIDSSGYQRKAQYPGVGVNATLDQSASAVVNVKSFGAIGDGVIDDTASLQAAITYAAANGYTVQLSGTHIVSASLTVSGRIIGPGTIKHAAGTEFTVIAPNGEIELNNLTINGNMANVTGASPRWSRLPVLQSDGYTVRLIGVTFTACRGQAAYVLNGSKVRVLSCVFANCDNWAFVGRGLSDVVISDCTVDTVYTHGLYCDGASTRVVITGNTVKSCLYDAAYTGSGIGISVHTAVAASFQCVIDANVIYTCGNMGISYTGSYSGTVADAVISNNVINGMTTNLGYGIEIISDGVTVSGNSITDCLYSVTIQNCARVAITGNVFTATVQGRVAVGLLPADANADFSEVLIANNIFQNLGFCIQRSTTVTSTTCHHLSVQNNVFKSCRRALVFQQPINDCIISGNNIDSTGCDSNGDGMSVYGDRLAINNNNIVASLNGNGISISGTSGTVTIKGNNITPSGTGYALVTSAVITLWIVNDNETAAANTVSNASFATTYRERRNSWDFAAAAPASGYWRAGTWVENTAPAAAGAPGWVCVTSGTPGTWKAMANIAP